MAIPIVFIHQGNSSYLPWTLLQCRHWNPHSEIILLGDASTRHFGSIVEHVPFHRYTRQAEEFSQIYQHYSTNGAPYELFCIQRWFILREYLSSRRLTRAVYLDSDILVYSDLSVAAETAGWNGGMTVAGVSAHSNVIRDLATLDGYLSYITRCYAAPDSNQQLRRLLDDHQRNMGPLGGISDMTFFRTYREQFPDEISDVSVPATDATCFDITIDTAQGMRCSNGYKSVDWKDNQPWCTEERSGRRVRFHTLHFQGASKALLRGFIRPPSTLMALMANCYIGIYHGQRLVRRLHR